VTRIYMHCGEPTSGLEPLTRSLGVIGSGLSSVAQAYRCSMKLKSKNHETALTCFPAMFICTAESILRTCASMRMAERCSPCARSRRV